MRKQLLRALPLAFVICLASCTNVSEVKVNYLTPGKDGIAMASGASFKLVASDNPLAQQVKAGVAQSFDYIAQKNVSLAVQRAKNAGQTVDENRIKEEQLKISDENPDYWMFITVNNEHRADTPETVEFNAKWVKVKQENQSGGAEVLQKQPGVVTDSTAAVVNIAIYSRHGLLPIHEFTVACWNTGDQQKFYDDLVQRVIHRINDGLQKMDRSIVTLIPNQVAGSSLAKAIVKNDPEKIQSCITALKLKPLTDFLADTNGMMERHDKKALKSMAEKMGYYYLAVLDYERNNLDTRSLRFSHRCYLAMLKTSQDDGFSDACADSLARVEGKLALLDSVKK